MRTTLSIIAAAAVAAGGILMAAQTEPNNFSTAANVEIGGMTSGTVRINGVLVEPDEDGNISIGDEAPEAPVYTPIPWD
jgi:hypothetical protein